MGLQFLGTILIVLGLSSTVFGAGPTQAILVDRSGSMKPYYANGVVSDLLSKCQKLLGSNGTVDLVAFSDSTQIVRSADELAKLSWGNFTYLDKAIDFAVNKKYSVVWMITDNVQDQPGAPEAGNTDVFYQKLRGEAVKKVVILPLKQQPGISGIAIYAILLSAESHEVFDKQIAQFLHDVKDRYRAEALLMKPLDRDSVELTFVRGKLQPGKSTVVYREGEEIRETLDLKFKSRLEHLKIVDAEVEVAQTTAQFSAASLLTSEKKNATITPTAVPTLDPQGETKQVYTVSIDLAARGESRE